MREYSVSVPWLWLVALFLCGVWALSACDDSVQTAKKGDLVDDTAVDDTLEDGDLSLPDLEEVDGADTEDVETKTDIDADQPCPSDRVCGSACCAEGSYCSSGVCNPGCASGVTCGESGGLCCKAGHSCLEDETCGLSCPDNGVPCVTPLAEICCAFGEVCSSGRCLPDCGEYQRCGDLCCGANQMCHNEVCVARCPTHERLCGVDQALCCEENERCLNNRCIVPGKSCSVTEECEIDEYCEPVLGACVPRSAVDICEYRPPVGVFTPQLKCLWTAPPDNRIPACGTATDSVLGRYSDVVMTPAVANLTDDNGDGVTDENDIPDIVFASFDYNKDGCCTDKGILRIVSGECNPDGTMNTIATLDDVWVDNSGGIALGNLHPASMVDERNPEIVTVGRNGGTTAWRRLTPDGTQWEIMWRNTSYLTNAYTRGGTQPSLADLDGDGAPEVIVGNVVLNGLTGALIWDGQQTATAAGLTGGVGNNAFLGPISTVADLDLDGKPEVIAGNTVYDGLTGAVKWQYTYTSSNSGCGGNLPCDGYSAVGNFDADPEGEVVIVRLGEVFVLEHTGALKHKVQLPKVSCGNNEAGPPTIADFDGDGKPDIGTAGADYYVVINFACVGDPLPEACDSEHILWKVRNQDCSSRATGSSVFDFDGDGAAEVVYADEKNFRIFDGRTGAILFDDASHRSNTRLEMPIVVDVDNDGKAEVLVPTAAAANDYGGLGVWSDADNNWVRTRRIWNQHAYHVTNISEDGQVPAYEYPNWLHSRLNNFRQNVQPGGIFDAPDLVVDSVTVSHAACAQNSTLLITVHVGNQGSVGVARGIDVYAEVTLPGSGETFVLGVEKTTEALLPSNTVPVTFTWVPPFATGHQAFVVMARVDDDGTGRGQYNECREDNNEGERDGFMTCTQN